MHDDAIQKGVLWRLARTLVVGAVLMFLMTLITKELALGGTAYAIGFLVVLFLATLTDRKDFYYAGPRPQEQEQRAAEARQSAGLRWPFV